jgi:hypothetical protein
MNISRSVLVERHRLKQNIVACSVLGNLLMQIDNLVNLLTDFKRVGVHLFADLTFKSFPVVRTNILVSGAWTFVLFLSQNPVFEALEMDDTYRSLTFAG